MRPSEAAAGQFEALLAEEDGGGTYSAPSDAPRRLLREKEVASTLRMHAVSQSRI